jgi:hypothetical protein
VRRQDDNNVSKRDSTTSPHFIATIVLIAIQLGLRRIIMFLIVKHVLRVHERKPIIPNQKSKFLAKQQLTKGRIKASPSIITLSVIHE